MVNISMREKIISNLISTSKNIKCLYDNMNYQNKEKLEKELKFEIKKEDVLLDLLNITEENSKEIYNELSECLNDSLLENVKINTNDKTINEMFSKYFELSQEEALHTNDLVRERFESYLIKKFKPNPVTTSKRIEAQNLLVNNYGKNINKIKDLIKCLSQDKALIRHQANLDYYTSAVKYLDDFEKNAKTPEEFNQSTFVKNQILFKDKAIEEKCLNDDLSLDGYDKCIENGHNRKFVDTIYSEFLYDNINEYGSRLYLYSDKTLSNKEEQINFNVTAQFFKAGLYLMDIEELKEISMDYQYNNMNNSKQSVRLVENAMIEVIDQKENEQVKKLKK